MARAPLPIVIDFETRGIQRRPEYPPIPVGFSIQHPGERKSTYYAWGHPTENNCSLADGKRVLKRAWDSRELLLFHNAKFDYDVALTHMGVKELPWDRIHDTLYLLFLHDPHALSLGLKPAAKRLLGMEQEEKDAVAEWLIEHEDELRAAGLIDQSLLGYSDKGAPKRLTRTNAGSHIAVAPGGLVGKYANGDVLRTLKLFKLLYPEVVLQRGMGEAYDRERRLMPLLLKNEAEGVRADRRALRNDVAMYEGNVIKVDNWLRKKLKAPDLNVDSDQEVADALDRNGIVTDWVMTPPSRSHPEGQRSVAKQNMTPSMFRDKVVKMPFINEDGEEKIIKSTQVAAALGYRNRAQTCLNMFMKKWLHQAEASPTSCINTNWNQVRQTHGNDAMAGARTGRLSSNPNFQNIPKNFIGKGDDYVHPEFLGVEALPLMRSYLLPDVGGVWGHRDYNQQELRILAHFEDGTLLVAYQQDPRLDVHKFVQREIQRIYGVLLPRSAVKILNFGMIYGMGLAKIAIGVKSSVEEARRIKSAQLEAIPGLKLLDRNIKDRGKAGEPIVTWGGREYFTEPPLINSNYTQTFEYKLLNYLIQGSAADCTKEALIRYMTHPRRVGRFLVTVHDEINISIPRKAVRQEMALLREVMQSIEFDVPMLSDGKTGPSWGDLTKFKEAA